MFGSVVIAGAMLTIPSVGQADKPGDASEGKPAQTAANCAETVRSEVVPFAVELRGGGPVVR